MKMLWPVLVFVVLQCWLAWMRRGHGGKIGRAVRRSDHNAWEMAVLDKQAQINSHMYSKRAAFICPSWNDRMAELNAEMRELDAAEPRLFDGDVPNTGANVPKEGA